MRSELEVVGCQRGPLGLGAMVGMAVLSAALAGCSDAGSDMAGLSVGMDEPLAGQGPTGMPPGVMPPPQQNPPVTEEPPPQNPPVTEEPPPQTPVTEEPPPQTPPVTEEPPVTEPPHGGTCCPDGDCVCRGEDPTEASATAPGPFKTERYADGFRDGPAFLGATIYYPTDAEPPLSAVVLCPGWTSLQESIAGWGPFLASHGIVVMTIDTNTPLDWVDVRDDALLDALESLKAENTRTGSPLFGQLTDSRFGLGGWSMGGGGTWIAVNEHPELKTGMTLAGHHVTAGGPMLAAGITVPTIMFAGALDTDILGGGGQSQAAYGAVPESTPKILYELAAADHFAFGTPTTTGGGALGRYGLAFQKVFLEGDERYRKLLLVEGPGASDWMSNIE